jgi:hypothetical protein
MSKVESIEDWEKLVPRLEQLVQWQENNIEYLPIVTKTLNAIPTKLKTTWEHIVNNPKDLLKCYYQTSDVFNFDSETWNAEWFLSSAVSKLDFVICQSIVDCIVAVELDKIAKENLSLKDFANQLHYSYLLYPKLKVQLNKLIISNSSCLKNSNYELLPPLIKEFLIKNKVI